MKIIVIKDNIPKIVKPDRKTRKQIIERFNEQKKAERANYDSA